MGTVGVGTDSVLLELDQFPARHRSILAGVKLDRTVGGPSYCRDVTNTQGIAIAGRVLPNSECIDKLRRYPLRTLCRYDLPGPGDPNILKRDEIVRTRAVSSRISDVEVDWCLEHAEDAPWRRAGEHHYPQNIKLSHRDYRVLVKAGQALRLGARLKFARNDSKEKRQPLWQRLRTHHASAND